jgi:hypothetical protein
LNRPVPEPSGFEARAKDGILGGRPADVPASVLNLDLPVAARHEPAEMIREFNAGDAQVDLDARGDEDRC